MLQKPISVEDARTILRDYDFSKTRNLFGRPLTQKLRDEAVRVISEAEEEPVLVRTRFGALLLVYPQSDLVTSRLLLLDGTYEHATITFIQSALRPGDVYVDVGANIGTHSIAAALAIGESGSVVAIEPNPAMVRRLTVNLALTNVANVRIAHCAIGLEPKSAYLVASGVHPGTGVLLDRQSDVQEHADVRSQNDLTGMSQWIIPIPGQNRLGTKSSVAAQVHDVEVRPLDQVLNNDEVERATLVKIDVEGAEMAVIQSGSFLWDRGNPPAVIVEYEERYPGARAEIFDYFAARGWTSFLVSVDDLSRPIFNRLSTPDVSSQFENIYIIPPSRLSAMTSGRRVVDYRP